MLFIKKQYLVSQAHYYLTVKSSPVSIDKIKLLFQLVNKDVTISQSYITCYHSCGKNIQWKKNDLITRLYLYFLYFQSVQSGKTKILPPHQTGLVTINLHLLTRPVW